MKKKVTALLLALAVLVSFSVAPLWAGGFQCRQYVYYPCPEGGIQAGCTLGEPQFCIPFPCGG